MPPLPPAAAGAAADAGLSVPPYSLPAEQALLSGLMREEQAWDTVADLVAEPDFYVREHRLIFAALRDLAALDCPRDIVTLSEWLERDGRLADAGGLPYLGQVVHATGSAANVKAYATLVREHSVRRQLISVGAGISDIALQPAGRDVPALLDEAERRVFAIAEQAQRGGGFTPLRVLLSAAVDRIETLFARKEPITGLPTGFSDLDEMTSGLQPADLIIVAGRPSMGKCLQADSEILLADGRLARIETLVQSRAARLLTLYPDGQLRFITPTAYVADGQKPMFRVTTALGRQIETTASHPFLTPAGWQPLAALRPVQAIAVPGALPVFGAAALPEATVIALAQAQAALDRDPARGAAAPWPDASLTLPRHQLALFLRTLFAAAGAGAATTPLTYAPASAARGRRLQHLLLRFGLVARLGRADPAAPGAWRLTLATPGAQRRWRAVCRDNAPAPALPAVGWDAITAITYRGVQPVYDLTIPVTHNFVANDICVHNTSFAMNMAENVALQVRRPVAIFSMEMPGDSLALRLISSLGRIDQHRVRTGKLEDDEWPRLTHAVQRLADLPLFIDDTAALSPTEIRARARRLKREHGDLGLIVIDYLQLMQVPGNQENRATEIATISRALKAMAKELHVPVIALSQLNRGLEQRTSKRPVMSDLRECVTGETRVVLADGRRQPIRALVGHTPTVYSLAADGRLITAVADRVWAVGWRPVVELHFASGQRLRCTPQHWLYGPAGWQRVATLRPGDRLALWPTGRPPS